VMSPQAPDVPLRNTWASILALCRTSTSANPGKPNTYRILSLEERRARREAAP
jgi:hypothetical protein